MSGHRTDDPVVCGRLRNSETLRDLGSLLSHLTELQRAELTELIRSFPTLFGDTPSRTHLIEHDIDVGACTPIKQRFYRSKTLVRKRIIRIVCM